MYVKSKYKDNTLNLFHPKCLSKTLPTLYLSAPIEKCKQTKNSKFINEPENQGMFCQSGCQIKRALHSTAMLHEQHGVSNQRQLEFCSTAYLCQQNWKMKAPYGSFVKVSHRAPKDSPHKGASNSETVSMSGRLMNSMMLRHSIKMLYSPCQVCTLSFGLLCNTSWLEKDRK